MNFEETVKRVSTATELKRFASAYVIDYSRLSIDEIKEALIKTAPQYSHYENVVKSINDLILDKNRDIRILGMLILKTILLDADDFMMEQKELEKEVIEYEQEINRKSAEDLLSKSNAPDNSYDLFKFVLETAWDYQDEITPDERNLIEKIKNKLSITDYEYNLIEAEIGKYPKPNNELHTTNEIETVRRELQKKGLLMAVRDSSKKDYDVIPCEIAESLRKLWNIEMRSYGYEELIKTKYVRNKKYMQSMLEKGNIQYSNGMKTDELQALCVERLKPSVLIGGYTSRDGLDVNTLASWCQDLVLPVSGQKVELIGRIINYYDEIRKKPDSSDLHDDRSILFDYFDELASRNLDTLRQQQIITKDLECERLFEDATNYIFEKYFKQKPLMLKGTEHPDGILSFNDKLIYWDNKSKETPVNLADHIKQFTRYIDTAEKPVASFLVIGPSFTESSEKECRKHSMMSETPICLITAKQLKDLAENWTEDKSFPLQYLRQSGPFDSSIID
jgi:hypothetical protein